MGVEAVGENIVHIYKRCRILLAQLQHSAGGDQFEITHTQLVTTNHAEARTEQLRQGTTPGCLGGSEKT